MFRRVLLLAAAAILISQSYSGHQSELKNSIQFTDSDSDGYNDSDDAFPDHPDAWSDGDGDGYADQPNTNISDDCPNTYGISKIHLMGCRDIDRDWIPDFLDDDIDGDGIPNELELASSNAVMKFDIFNPESVPDDSDFDTIPDPIDPDDDNDGWSDLIEIERWSDPYDEFETPFSMYGGTTTGFYYIPGKGITVEATDEGFEISLSWLIGAVSSELIIPIGLIPIYLGLWGYRRKKFKEIDNQINSSMLFSELAELEKMANQMVRERRIRVVHGLILRNSIEEREVALGGEGRKGFSDASSEE